MNGTLIGVFLTGDSVLVGADTQVALDAGGHDQIAKTCEVGVQGVATLQGRYGYEHPNGTRAPLIQIFRGECGRIHTEEPNVALSVRADNVVERLRVSFAAYLAGIPAADFSLPFFGDPHIAYVTVAGLENGVPTVVARQLGARLLPEGNWEAFTRASWGLSASGCGVKFHGHDTVALALFSVAPPAVPLEERGLPEAVAGRLAVSGDCESMTLPVARQLYITVVGATIRRGTDFGVPEGHVGGELHLWEITENGVVMTIEPAVE